MRSSLDDEDEDLNITASPSPAGEPAISTTFYYIPGSSRDDCAGMEEELFYNTKYETITDDDQPSSYYTGKRLPIYIYLYLYVSVLI